MPRKHLFRTNEYPYHISARSNNKDWFQIPMDQCWEIFAEVIAETANRYNFKTHLFVLMDNHFHWILSTPDANLDEGMQYFMTQTSWRIARASNRINKIYGARYKPTLILTTAHYANAHRYVYLNPVKAKICKSPYDYPWSTLTNKSIEIFSAGDFEQEILKEKYSDWLMLVNNEMFYESTKKALRRTVFKYPRDPKSGRRNDTPYCKKSTGTF